MSSSADGGSGTAACRGGRGGYHDDEVKSQFMTREGTYRLMAQSEYSRPNRAGIGAGTAGSAHSGMGGGLGYSGLVGGGGGGPGGVLGAGVGGSAMAGGNSNNNGGGGSLPVRISFTSQHQQQHGAAEAAPDEAGPGVVSGCFSEQITFNYGREIFVYPYRGPRKAADLTKPVDKRVYKGTCPTCHDFGSPIAVVRPGGGSDSVNGVNGGGGQQSVVPLLVGFSGGQIQLIDPFRKELSKLFNEERLLEKTRVTCIKWIPGSKTNFLVSYASGNMYVFNHELTLSPTVPSYQTFKQGPGFVISTCKTKTTRNPLFKWTVGSRLMPPQSSSSSSSSSNNSGGGGGNSGHSGGGGGGNTYTSTLGGLGSRISGHGSSLLNGVNHSFGGGSSSSSNSSISNSSNNVSSSVTSNVSNGGMNLGSQINEFAFSPCGHFLAVVSQDGHLRVFNFDTMELTGTACSYFGGLLCVSWSPDGKYIAVGGEDDLVTVYSVAEKRVVLRGQGHKSWVSVVAFDKYNLSYGDLPDGLDFSGSDEESSPSSPTLTYNSSLVAKKPPQSNNSGGTGGSHGARRRTLTSSSDSEPKVTCYRLGSAGQDTLLCLWDITDEALTRSSTSDPCKCGKDSCDSSSSKGCSAAPLSLCNHQRKGSSPSGSSSLGGDTCCCKTSIASSCKDSGLENSAASNTTTGSSSASTAASSASASTSSSSMSLTHRFASSLSFGSRDKESKEKKKNSGSSGHSSNSNHLIANGGSGTGSCNSSDRGSSSSLLPNLSILGGGSAGHHASNHLHNHQNCQHNNHSGGCRIAAISNPAESVEEEPARLGSLQCPRIGEVPIIEPLVSKKIAHERLTALVFKEDCFVTACQDGYVCTWARPGRVAGSSTGANNVPCTSTSHGVGGTVV